jgi:hypothetical protein
VVVHTVVVLPVVLLGALILWRANMSGHVPATATLVQAPAKQSLPNVG